MTRSMWMTMVLSAALTAHSPAAAQSAYHVLRARPTPSAQDDRTVTLSVRDSTLAYVVQELTRQAQLQLSYQTGNPQFRKHVRIDVTSQPVMKALATVLEGTGLTASLSPNGAMVVIQPAPATRAQGTGVISGRIVDSATGHGIRGATVRVEGTKLSAVTGDDGQFVVRNVPSGDRTVGIRALGYHSVTRSVTVINGKPVTIHVTVSSVATMLSGVVTTATGTQRRLEVGSDITILNVDSVMKTAPITSVTDLLEGRVPGLTVTHTSGTPGDPSRLRLRGAASIQRSNDPIVIIDGVRMYYSDANRNGATTAGLQDMAYPRPSPLDQIDPNSIETIEVFKGPSASSLYGSDAANGVIVITTKRGQAGKTHWSLSAGAGTSSIPGSYPTMTFGFGHLLTGGNSLQLPCNAGGFANVGPCMIDSTISFQALNDSRYSPLTRGENSDVSGTVSGGVQNLTYSLTGSWAGEGGMVRLPDASRDQYLHFVGKAPPSWMNDPDNYTRWGLSGVVTAELSRTAHVTVTNRISNSDQQRSSLGLAGIGDLLGTFVDTTRLGTTALIQSFTEQAVANTDQSTNAVTFDWQTRPWLHVSLTGGLDQNHNTDKTFLPSGLPIQLASSFDTAGAYSLARLNSNVKTLNLNTSSMIPLPYGKSIRLSLGVNAQTTRSGSETIRTASIPRGVNDPSSFVPDQTSVSQATVANSTYGWYIEPQLQLSSRFFFSPGIRLDGGSASGGNAGFTGFPKMALSWVALDQSDGGAGWRRALSQLRLRGAYGYAGVQPGPADQLRLVTQSVAVINGTSGTSGVQFSTQGNTHLRPERSSELELGFDAEFLDSRLQLTTTYFHKKRLDAIMTTRIAASAGGGTQRKNIGTVRNAGLEFDANAQLVRSAPLQWDVHMRAGSQSNKLLSFAEGFNSSPGGLDSRLVVGYPIDGIWTRDLIGYADANGNGVIETSELVVSDSAAYLGTQNAPFTSSFGTRVATLNGRLAFNADFDYSSGVTQYNKLALAALRTAANVPNATLDDRAIYMASAYASLFSTTNDPTGPNRYLYQTVSTLRWRSVSVNYTMPTAIARALRGQSMTVSVQGSNLWLHTNYLGKDPNVNATLTGEGVTDFGQIPQPRTWVLRVSLTN